MVCVCADDTQRDGAVGTLESHRASVREPRIPKVPGHSQRGRSALGRMLAATCACTPYAPVQLHKMPVFDHAQGVGAFFTVYVVYALHPTEEGNLL